MFQSKNKTRLIKYLLTVSVAALLLFNQTADAGTHKKTDEQLSEEIKSNDMPTRTVALNYINRNSKNAPLNKETIEQILFLAEKQRKDNEYTTKGELGESYYSALLDALGNTRDTRAIPYLIENLGGTAVSRGLLKIGAKAIDPLIVKLHSDVVGYRESAAQSLVFFLKPDDNPYFNNNEIKDKIKKAFLYELKDPRNKNPDIGIDWYEYRARERASVRRSILQGLGYLALSGDNDVLFLIKSAAEEDPYYLDMSKKTNYTGPKKIYMVREEAQKILDSLKANAQHK